MRTFLRTNWLLLFTMFLVLFIPLYPKLPLADIIPGYLVRIRLEDFVVLFIGVIWMIQFLRRQVVWNTFFFWGIVAYLFTGLLSVVSGALLNETVPLTTLHLGKSLLHLFRYAEYFSLFVIGFGALTAVKQLNTIFKLLLVAVVGIVIYGAGQKYLSWPVYSTMNREYAKGEALTLGEHAKVQSTFGGHYDLAAYLVIVLPIIFTYFLYAKTWYVRLILLAIETGGLWMLVLSGSKTSLLAVILAHAVVVGLFLKKKGFFADLGQRFHLGKALAIGGGLIVGLCLIIGSVAIINPEMAKTFLNLAAKFPLTKPVVSRFYEPAMSANPGDWINADPIYEKKTVVLDNGETTTELVKKELAWSQNALKYGISMGIRLDTLWPNAVTGLRRNPYLGSGYGTLNKAALNEFTDSDSTDNNYLRTLGETGFFGFTLFYGLLAALIFSFARYQEKTPTAVTVYSVALTGATIGLLFNAFYIDIFSASKVAFSYWLLAGLALKGIYLQKKDLAVALDFSRFKLVKKFLKQHWPALMGFLLIGLLTWRNPYLEEFTLLNRFNFSGDNYKHLVLAKCLVEEQTFSLCRPETLSLPVNFSPAYAFFLTPIYLFLNSANAYYFVNFAIFNLSFFLLYLILRKIIKFRLAQFAGLLFFVLNPFLRELVFKSTSLNLILLAVMLIIHFKLQLLPHFKRVYRVFFNHPATLFIAGSGGIFILVTMTLRHPDPFLNNFALDDKTAVYQTIKRANLAFGRLFEKKASLITTVNPYYFDLYGNGNYHLLPYSPDQELYANAKFVWGDFGFDYNSVQRPEDLSPLFRTALERGPLYFTNHGIGDFTALRRNFSFKVIDLDCQEHCNLYELKSKKVLPKITEAKVVGKIPFTSLKGKIGNETLKFTVLSHTYPDLSLPENALVAGKPERYTEASFGQRLSPILSSGNDFVVILGNLGKTLEKKRLELFNLNFTSRLNRPLINVPYELDLKKATNFWESFTLGDNYFLNFRPTSPVSLTKGETMDFYNLFYDLEYAPTNYVFIFTYDNLAQNPDFTNHIMPLLNQLSSKSIYLISSNQGSDPKLGSGAMTLGNLTFLQTGFSENTKAEALEITIDQKTGVIISPKTF